jgi:hypothetical protein
MEMPLRMCVSCLESCCCFAWAYIHLGTYLIARTLCMVLTLYIISIFQAGRKTLADKFDYVMHGKLYKISEDSSSGQATKVYGFYEFQI